MKIVHIDFEARSRVDVTEVGAYRYAVDPSTVILMCAVSVEGSDKVYLWVHPKWRGPGMESDPEVFEVLRTADLVFAHNYQFERAMLRYKMPAEWAMEDVPVWRDDQWRCTGALARCAGMPHSLANLSNVLNLGDASKDKYGKQLISWFSAPDPKTGEFRDPSTSWEKWAAFGEYCRQDVRAEKAVHDKLRGFDLSGWRLETFLFDMRINDRGVHINVPAIEHAKKIAEEEAAIVEADFEKRVGLRPTQKQKFKAHLATLGLDLPNMQALTIENALAELPEDHPARPVLDLYERVGFSAISKLDKMLQCVMPDGYLRGMFVWHGAHTGRWSSTIVQLQNFRKPSKWMKGLTGPAYAAIKKGMSREDIDYWFGPPMEVIASIVRQFIEWDTPIFDGDYNAVEARGVCYVAKQEDVLARWEAGEDLYIDAAARIYEIPPSEVSRDERDGIGKRTILGCGYQMAWRTFKKQSKIQYNLDFTKEISKKAIKVYREMHPKVKDCWYELNSEAMEAIRNPGSRCGRFVLRKVGSIPYLLLYLPSGRPIAYPWPKLEWETVEYPIDEDDESKGTKKVSREGVTYWGEIKKGVFGRIKLYGGAILENYVQGMCGDQMAYGGMRAEDKNYLVSMLIHDQAIAPKMSECQTPQEYSSLLATLPPWTPGFPLKVEAKEALYYAK